MDRLLSDPQGVVDHGPPAVGIRGAGGEIGNISIDVSC